MTNDFMRVLVFFDLPVVTRKERKIYTQFRHWLIGHGYNMLQFSVYAKICNNHDAAKLHLIQLRKFVPRKGAVRVMLITEKQYARMEILVGGQSLQERAMTIDPILIL